MGKYWALTPLDGKILGPRALSGKILGHGALQWEILGPSGPSQQSKAHIDHNAGASFCTCSTAPSHAIQPCTPLVYLWQQCLPACPQALARSSVTTFSALTLAGLVSGLLTHIACHWYRIVFLTVDVASPSRPCKETLRRHSIHICRHKALPSMT